jgi:hypothetical protein
MTYEQHFKCKTQHSFSVGNGHQRPELTDMAYEQHFK